MGGTLQNKISFIIDMIRLTNTHSAHTYTLHSGMKQPVYNSNIKFSYLIALYTEVTHETNVLT